MEVTRGSIACVIIARQETASIVSRSLAPLMYIRFANLDNTAGKKVYELCVNNMCDFRIHSLTVLLLDQIVVCVIGKVDTLVGRSWQFACPARLLEAHDLVNLWLERSITSFH